MLKNKLSSITKKQEITIISLVVLFGFLIRMFYTPFGTPISGDAIDYFSYSIALARGEIFPDGYILNKFGWPIFLSPFLAIFDNSEILDLMNVQRILSITISVVTIVPLYFLIKNFFKKEIAIVASSLFIFSPKVIENSLLGISDSFFIFLITIVVMLVFVKNSKYYFLSYIIAGFAFIVRQEGILILIPLIIFFIVKKEFTKEKIMRISIGLIVFCIITFAANYALTNEIENISIFDTVIHATQISNQEIVISSDNKVATTGTITNNITEFIKNASFNYSKFLIWILLPNAVCFILLSIFTFQKTISKNRIIILGFFIFLSFISLFAYGKGIQEVRYLLVLLPLLALFSGYGLTTIQKRINKKILFFTIPIIISSIIFVSFDYEEKFENESFEIAKKVIQNANGINDYEESRFVKVAKMYDSWPELLPYGENREIYSGIEKFISSEYENLNDYIFYNYDKGLTHLVIYEENNAEYFDIIFQLENDFPYLTKIYDSSSLGHEKPVKIFEIKYELFKRVS